MNSFISKLRSPNIARPVALASVALVGAVALSGCKPGDPRNTEVVKDESLVLTYPNVTGPAQSGVAPQVVEQSPVPAADPACLPVISGIC